MFLSNASIRRPIAMGCLIIALTLLGFNAYRKMGLELMPKTDLPYITVTTIYPGASPSEIETDVAKRIEDQMVTIDGLKHVTSSCMENVCATLLEFNLGVDVDVAATDVREKLDLIRADFPEDVEDPKILKYDVNAKAVAQMSLTGDLPLDELYDYADNTLRDRLTVISGVADVTLVGGSKREVHVLLDRDKLVAKGLTSYNIVQSIKQNIKTIPSGRVKGQGMEYSVKFDANYARVEDIGSLEVANSNGQRVYLKDIGHVEMTTEELRQSSKIDGRNGIAIKVVKKADANAVAVVENVKKAIEKIKNELPGGMELIWVTDDGLFTESTVNSAWEDVAIGIGLTALILFLFLYNLRALLVVGITMPLTIIISLFFIYFMGYTFNTMTLLAIGMGVGILVTNSIIVMEAIVKRLDETGDPKQASRLGASEVVLAVLASAGTHMVVLFPLAMMESTFGLFIKAFALSMALMTAVSLFISFTLTPMLCSIMLKPRDENPDALLHRMEKGWNRMLDKVISGYGRSLAFLEKHRWAEALFLIGIVALLFHSLYVAGNLGSSTLRDTDKGEVFVKMEFPTWYSLAETEGRVQKALTILDKTPHLKHTLSTIGKVEGTIGQSTQGVNLAQVLLKFSERTERKTTISTLMEDVRKKLAGTPDAIVTVSIPNPVAGGQSSGVEMEIGGSDLTVLDSLATKAKAFSEDIPGLVDQDTTVRTGKPELKITPNREVLADIQSPATGLGAVLRGNLEGLKAGTFKQGARNYDIRVKFEKKSGKDQVKQFLFPGISSPVLLTSVGNVEETTSPVQITRKDKVRISKLFANLGENESLSNAVSDLTKAMNQKGNLDSGYIFQFGGMYNVMAEAQTGMIEAVILSIILVFLILGAIMESFKQPVLIFTTVPVAVIGVFYALAMAGSKIEMLALMGCVMLIGIVVAVGILIMDRFNILIKEGHPRHLAMVQACKDEFRPIAMITLAAVLGMMPMATGQGIGAELRNAAGIASMGGILSSAVLSMYLIPVLYNLFTRRGKAKHEEEDQAETLLD
jgi:hydrophobic/amphiphilic exporter-1 (mainly G- bacteria), HAE1 family